MSAVVLLIAHVRYLKILTSLRDFLVIFLYLVYFFALKLLLAIARQWSREKFAILPTKHRGHVGISLYRTWAIFKGWLRWVKKETWSHSRRCLVHRIANAHDYQEILWSWSNLTIVIKFERLETSLCKWHFIKYACMICAPRISEPELEQLVGQWKRQEKKKLVLLRSAISSHRLISSCSVKFFS